MGINQRESVSPSAAFVKGTLWSWAVKGNGVLLWPS